MSGSTFTKDTAWLRPDTKPLLRANQRGTGLVGQVVVGAVKRMKQGRGEEARKSSQRRFHVSPEVCREEYLCRRNGQCKGSVDGSVWLLGRQLGKGTGRRNGLCHVLCFSLYRHRHLGEARHRGRQNRHHQCQRLRVFKPSVPFLCIPVIGGHTSSD